MINDQHLRLGFCNQKNEALYNLLYFDLDSLDHKNSVTAQQCLVSKQMVFVFNQNDYL